MANATTTAAAMPPAMGPAEDVLEESSEDLALLEAASEARALWLERLALLLLVKDEEVVALVLLVVLVVVGVLLVDVVVGVEEVDVVLVVDSVVLVVLSVELVVEVVLDVSRSSEDEVVDVTRRFRSSLDVVDVSSSLDVVDSVGVPAKHAKEVENQAENASRMCRRALTASTSGSGAPTTSRAGLFLVLVLIPILVIVSAALSAFESWVGRKNAGRGVHFFLWLAIALPLHDSVVSDEVFKVHDGWLLLRSLLV